MSTKKPLSIAVPLVCTATTSALSYGAAYLTHCNSWAAFPMTLQAFVAGLGSFIAWGFYMGISDSV